MSSLPPSAVRPLSRPEAEAIAARIPELARLPPFTAGVYIQAVSSGRTWPQTLLQRFELAAIRSALREIGPRPGGRS